MSKMITKLFIELIMQHDEVMMIEFFFALHNYLFFCGNVWNGLSSSPCCCV